MKYVKIVELNGDYARNFRSLLVQIGAKPVSGNSRLFEVEDHFDPDMYHGLQVVNPDANAEIGGGDHTKEAEWLESYSGSSTFFLSLQQQFRRSGTLSAKQWAVVIRESTKATTAPPDSKPEQVFSICVGELLVLSKHFAREIAAQAGCVRPHFVMEVTGILRETERAYQLTLKLSAQRTIYCGVCGLLLTNPESVTEGIGPVCAKRWGFAGEDLLEKLAEQLQTSKCVTTWIPKTAIKKRLSQDANKDTLDGVK